MTEVQGKPGSSRVEIPQDGHGGATDPVQARYCAICGEAVNPKERRIERFGEVFCSEGHAEEFVRMVREARAQAAAARALQATSEVSRAEAPAEAVPKQRDWKAYLGKALCWGAPLVALVFVLGGGGALLGAAGALLPVLALHAGPLGRYFMMRSMSKMEHRGNPDDKEGGKPGGSPGR
jgi:hypothetical protein